MLPNCNGSTKRGADGRTYSEHSRSPSYSRIELGLRTKYCAFWSGSVMGYETSKLITSDTDLERGNAQHGRWKIATTCWSPRVYVIQRTNGCGSA